MPGLWKAAGALAAVASAGAVTAGGWALVTVRELPEYFVAGREYRMEFAIRHHGTKPLSGLAPRLIVLTAAPRRSLFARAERAIVPATAGGTAGTYAATFTAPQAERVVLTIENGFGDELRLYQQPVVAPGRTPPPLAPAERGRVLFVAKGCNTCHANSDLGERPHNTQIPVGPALGGRRLAPEYVAAKLTGPASQRMPNLGLSDAEVGALVAFLNGGSGGARAGR